MHRKPKNSSAHLQFHLVTSPETPAPACHRHFPECPENATTSSTTGTTSIHDSRIAIVTTSMDHLHVANPLDSLSRPNDTFQKRSNARLDGYVPVPYFRKPLARLSCLQRLQPSPATLVRSVNIG
ncbi:hypothetical protein CCHR01_09288 [Colletotrichum chrysophilum]|uniref:Uncharacterized protein n=1 Tax=Colletotrichum chrysophilum TaxID=1836956 RepID=A0AAD9AH19_9PEZI|nr:hypothetical protein CCHR01_09288 [Colletotrichum chrysophilum]